MYKLLEHIIHEKQLEEFNAKQLAGSLALAGTLALAQPNVAGAMAHHSKHNHTQSKQHHQVHQSKYEQIVAEVIAGEGASEKEIGMRAIACVIQNRAGGKGHLYYDPANIVTARKQFSAYSDKDLMSRNYREVKPIADKLASEIGNLNDITNGANHYITKYLYDKRRGDPTFWANKMQVTKIIGKHVFLKGK